MLAKWCRMSIMYESLKMGVGVVERTKQEEKIRGFKLGAEKRRRRREEIYWQLSTCEL
jgi:hypothetical protein